MAKFVMRIDDDEICEAYRFFKDQIAHTDAPTEQELCLVRQNLNIENHEMLSLFWLRNRIVQLRKGAKSKS